MQVILDGTNEEVTCHCPATGKIGGLKYDEMKNLSCLVSPAADENESNPPFRVFPFPFSFLFFPFLSFPFLSFPFLSFHGCFLLRVVFCHLVSNEDHKVRKRGI